MQGIKYNSKLISPLFTYIEQFYKYTSDTNIPSGLFKPIFPTEFKPYLDVFDYYGYTFDFEFKDMTFDTIQLANADPKNIIVCASGGKDSVATIKYYLNKGYNVYVYHLKNINKCFADEYKRLEEIAKYLNVNLYLDSCNLVGENIYTEHPLKNLAILCGALNYGISNNITTNIAFGAFNSVELQDTAFEVDGGDSVEMYVLASNVMRALVPNFRVEAPLHDISESLSTYLNDPKLLAMTQSCIGTLRYRDYKRSQMEKKYEFKLMPNRCGCCWKCAVEYIYFSDKGILEYNEGYYKYCLNVLYRDLLLHDGIAYFIEDVWYTYLFYPIEESHLKEFKDNAVIYTRKITFVE